VVHQRLQLLHQHQSNDSGAITVRESLRMARFYNIFVILVFGSFYGLYVAAVYKTFDQDNLSDKVLTVAGALGSVCNGCSRIMWASLQDKYGFKKVYGVILVLQLILSLTIYQVRTNEYLYVTWVAISFLCEGGHFSCFPPAVCKIFGI
jgi:Na+/melibiose symporter-like transporter